MKVMKQFSYIISSPETKARVSFSDQSYQVNFSHFHLLQNPWTDFNQTWHKVSLGERSLFKCRAQPSSREELAKIHWRNLNIFFSRTTKPISTKLGTKHPCLMRTQFCSNEGHKLVLIITKFKNLPLNHCANGWRGFKFVQMKSQTLLKGR